MTREATGTVPCGYDQRTEIQRLLVAFPVGVDQPDLTKERKLKRALLLRGFSLGTTTVTLRLLLFTVQLLPGWQKSRSLFAVFVVPDSEHAPVP